MMAALCRGAQAGEVTWGGGGLFLWDFDRSAEVSSNHNTGVNKTTTLQKNVAFDMFWLDADARINDDLSFSARLSNISAAKWNALMVEGTGSAGSEVISFQHAYAGFNFPATDLRFRVGLLPVDRNMEPLQAHFTPQKTSWGSFWKATMGNIEGVNVQFPVSSGAVNMEGDLTISKFKNGDGRKVVSVPGHPDVITADDDWTDLIASLPMTMGKFQFRPLAAVRSSVGKGGARFTEGFTSSYNYSKGFNVSLGAGYSAYNSGDGVNSSDPDAENSRTVFVRVVPTVGVGKGQLMLDLKYSTFLDKSKTRDVLHRYPVADLKYSFKVHNNLTIVFPFVRYLGESYKDRNTKIRYTKDRLCAYIVFVVMV